MEFRRVTLVVAGTALAYYILYVLNQHLFAVLSFSTATSWVFLPSGVRLIAILLFVHWGALGIVLGGVALAFSHADTGGDPVTVVMSLCLSGLAPLLARQICIGTNELRADLTELSPLGLLRTTLIFSAISAALHQTWYAWRGLSPDVLMGFLVMFTGDVLGALLVIYAIKMALSYSTRLRGG